MSEFRVGEAAALLGVSPDTIRRLADSGRLSARRTPGGQRVVDGAELAGMAAELAPPPAGGGAVQSARNRLAGIVTAVTRDTVMAQVEIRAGRYRLVALVSREAADELGLEPGASVVASIKATNVGVERTVAP